MNTRPWTSGDPAHPRRGHALAALAAIALLLNLASCGKGGGGLTPLAKDFAAAIRASDETAFVRLHVQPGDCSPSGNYNLATKAGGTLPGEPWDRELRDAFRGLLRDLQSAGIPPDSLEFAEVEGVTMSKTGGDPDMQNFGNLRIRFRSSGVSYLFTLQEGMLSRRGWVLSGDPIVRFAKE